MSPHLPLTVRPARADDWPAVAALLDAAGLPRAGAEEHLASFLLAFRGDRLIACAGAETYGGDALLRSVAVAPGEQRSGIGAALIADVLARARALGLDAIYLRTTTAAGFFARFGFRVVDVDAVPAALRASGQFKGACPTSATTMCLAFKKPATPGAHGPTAPRSSRADACCG